jgi:uncharacterized SAM-binding protein YcdF (DUF218 family)
VLPWKKGCSDCGRPCEVNKLGQTKNKLQLLWVATGAAAVLALLALAACFAAGEFLVHTDEVKRSGAVVLLSGGSQERMDEAARLMRERYADLLILTDTDQRMPGGILEWEYIRLEMIENGVSPAQIQPTDHTVSSTRDEARAVREYLQRHRISSCLIVTDPYHTLRTRIIFKAEMQAAGIEVRVVPSGGHWYRPAGWFLSVRGWQATVSEYIKLVALILQGI